MIKIRNIKLYSKKEYFRTLVVPSRLYLFKKHEKQKKVLKNSFKSRVRVSFLGKKDKKKHYKKPRDNTGEGGFEPPMPLQACRFSRPVPSTTQTLTPTFFVFMPLFSKILLKRLLPLKEKTHVQNIQKTRKNCKFS